MLSCLLSIVSVVDCCLCLHLSQVTTNKLLFTLISFFEGTNHLVQGGKKDAVYISELFTPFFKKLDPTSTRIDCIVFDGAANVQKAGHLLEAKYPRIHVQTCAAHSVSLFFSDICNKIWPVLCL